MIVLTTGAFDAPHMGHVAFLRAAASLGEELHVGVLSDGFIEGYKGTRPLFSQAERITLLRLGFDNVGAVPNDDQWGSFRRWAPCVVAVGSDWARKDYLAQIGTSQYELDAEGVTIAYVPYTQGISTSLIKERANERTDPR